MESKDTDQYVVFVADNFHYMGEDDTYREGAYPTLKAAISVCKQIVDADLHDDAEPGRSPEQRYSRYTMFGADPFIVGPAEAIPFSAWTYAKAQCGVQP